jgi:hypothetical protein
MKQNWWLRLGLVALLALPSAACDLNIFGSEAEAEADSDGKGGTTGGGGITVTSVTGSVGTSVLCVGVGDGTRTVQITGISVLPAGVGQGVTFRSLTPNTLSVNSSGLVTALATGEGRIEIASTADPNVKHVIIFVVVGCSTQPQPAPVITFTASPPIISAGQSATLTWSSERCTPPLTASGGWSGSREVSGNLTVTPSVTTTYTLSCTGPGGSDTKSVTVTVTAAPVTYTASKNFSSLYPSVCSSASQPNTGQLTLTSSTGQTVSSGVTWSSANNGIATVNSSGMVTAVAAGTVRMNWSYTPSGGQLQTGFIDIVVSPCPQQATCPTLVDYTPAGGTIAQNESKSIQSIRPANWPSNCQLIWFTSPRERLRVNGDIVVQVDGVVFYAGGFNAVITGGDPGSATLSVQVVQVGSDGKWTRVGSAVSHTWTVTAPQE